MKKYIIHKLKKQRNKQNKTKNNNKANSNYALNRI